MENRMGGACDIYGAEEKCRLFRRGKLQERDDLEDLSTDGIILT
jgi:hypothetical protein